MWDLVGNPEDRFSQNEAHIRKGCFEGILRDIVEDGLQWKYFGMLDKVCCSNPDIDTLEILQVRAISTNLPPSTENNRLDIPTVEMGDDEEYDLSVLWCVIGDDDCLYLIMCDVMDPSCLKCFRHIDNGLWEFMFSTPRIVNQRGYSGYMTGHTSSASREIMLLYIVPTQKTGPRKQSKQLHVFVADLDSGTIMSRNVNQLSAGLHSSYTWKIVEGREYVYLLEIYGEGIEVTCRYRYKLRSKILERCKESVVVAEKTFPHVNDNMVLMQYDASTNDGKSVWFFAGNQHKASSLSEVHFDSEGKLSVQKHAPPPFSCATIFVAGKVSSETLSKADIWMGRIVCHTIDGFGCDPLLSALLWYEI